ncbi:MAG: NAD(P)H-hydrate dehydratase [Thermoleophilia bacterium]|nr:NAD(P)H-hydrate dehydratase [Thermoleophilia bacterium]
MTPFEPLFTAAEMRAAESSHGGPTLELMERAGAAAAEAALRRYPQARSFGVWCGTGANGGDGLVVARRLRAAGRDVSVRLLGREDKIAGDAAENLRRAHEAGVPFAQPGRTDVTIDALFGTGFSGAPRREAGGWIEELNDAGAPVLAVDVPSGVDASTGRVAGAAVQAEATVTFHGRKVGLVVSPGRFHAGHVEVADIGIAGGETLHRRVGERLLEIVPRRGERDNKYSAGFVVVVGGSAGLTGAPFLAAEAAMRAGAGYVRACVPASLAPAFAQRFVEVTTSACADDDAGRLLASAADTVLEAAERADAVALGPGLGRSEGTRGLVRALLDGLDLPVVLDGDGLWALAGHLDWVFSRHAATVLTPHSGELGRLLDRDSAWVDANRLAAVEGAADDVGAVVALKGADTLVAAPGRGLLACDLGTPGLASAGTGDVLTGIAAAFLAKGMEAQVGTAAAAAAAGLAARRAAERHGVAGLIARDVVEALSPTLSPPTVPGSA